MKLRHIPPLLFLAAARPCCSGPCQGLTKLSGSTVSPDDRVLQRNFASLPHLAIVLLANHNQEDIRILSDHLFRIEQGNLEVLS